MQRDVHIVSKIDSMRLGQAIRRTLCAGSAITGWIALASSAQIANKATQLSIYLICVTSPDKDTRWHSDQHSCRAMQVASLSLDLRSRQQQVDAMRGELQSAGTRLAAERQQTEQQASTLMEQLAIAQSSSADTKVHLCYP